MLLSLPNGTMLCSPPASSAIETNILPVPKDTILYSLENHNTSRTGKRLITKVHNEHGKHGDNGERENIVSREGAGAGEKWQPQFFSSGSCVSVE